MKTSPAQQVRELYDESAESYSDMMDKEIDLPLYDDTLSRLAERIADLQGPVIDTSCGPGQMLARYHARHDSKRPLIGIDLSPQMIEIASSRLASIAETTIGDMRNLESANANSAAALLSFFALHHLEPDEAQAALQEWHRVLQPGGQLVLATWEGTGPIDYGKSTSVVALRYRKEDVTEWAQNAGFVLNHCVQEAVEGMDMQAIYLEATKQ